MGHSIPKRDRAGTMAGWATGPNKSTAQGSPEDDWLSGVVHDLNNELTILKGRVDLLRRMADRAAVIERAQLRQNLLPVDAVTRKLIRLTGQLLDLCLLQTGRRFDLERRRSDLVALTRQIAAEQQQITERHAVCLETALESLTGWWDAARLERVLDNLLGNAAKYSPCGGAIAIRIKQEGDRSDGWAVLTVSDAGLGIAPADLPHIFEPRYRGTNVAGNQNGSGMGLAVVRQIVEAHGGTVTVESRLGRGSTFTVRLPLAVPA
jgi:signal transduction histidine kinase